jgi:hypothetical protein
VREIKHNIYIVYPSATDDVLEKPLKETKKKKKKGKE